MAKAGVELGPSGRHRAGRLKRERTLAGEPAGVVNRPRRRVVAVTLRDPRLVDEQPQETTPIAPGVAPSAPRYWDDTGPEQPPPEEAALALPRPPRGNPPPVRFTHGNHGSDGGGEPNRCADKPLRKVAVLSDVPESSSHSRRAGPAGT